MSGSCPVAADNAFGPIIQGCNHADFTLLFEQSILSIGPSALLLCIAPLRTFGLRRKPFKTLKHRGLLSKLTVLLLLAGVELASLILWARQARNRTDVSIAAATLLLVSNISLVILSYAEHTRCIQPSAIINIYLSSSLLLDIPQARTLFNRGSTPESIAILFVCSMILKSLALLLEAQNKKRYLKTPYQNYSPEALSSIINRSFQWWVNPLFIRGFRQLLSMNQLFPPDRKLASQKLFKAHSNNWPRVKSKSKHPLRRSLLSQLKYQIIATLVPRVFLIAFKFCQPLLINRITSVLSSGSTATYDNFLIPAAVLIYGGLAVCSSLFRFQMSRTMAMARGILVSAIFDKTVDSSDTGNKAPLTLMTNDSVRVTTYMDRLIDGMLGSAVEIAVALVLLAREIGWVCVVPIILSAVAAAWGFWNSGAAAPLQMAWIAASQERVSFITKILAFPKALKMLGLTEIFGEQIQELRFKETELSKPMTRFGVLRNTIGYAPGIWGPPATLAIAVLVKGNGYLSVEKAFTTLSIVALLTSPVENLVQSVPMLGAAAALLNRIEQFLVKDEEMEPVSHISSDEIHDRTELQQLSSRVSMQRNTVIHIEKASFGYDFDKHILENINLSITDGTLTTIYGPVGCGKSTLLRAIIGNIKPAAGSISREMLGMSYCAQESWIPNLSIQNIITMETEADLIWYNTVIEACNIIADIRRMPDGDDTLVGSKGVQLSGGQRQRIALARALYSRNSIIVADDVLSGLDPATSSKVFSQVFGPTGLCRKQNMTAILATHNKQFASQADHVVMFGPDHTIISQGRYEQVNKYLKAAVLATNVSSADVEDHLEEVVPKNDRRVHVSDTEKDLKRKTGDLSLYVYYCRNIGILHAILFVVPATIFNFCMSFPSVWLKWWAQDATHTTSKNGMYIGVYFAFSLGTSTLGFIAMRQFVSVIVPLSGRNLHQYLLDAVLKAPYSHFASVDTGVLLNRFSQDMVMIDANLSGAAFMAIMFVMQATMEAGLIVSGSVYITAVIPAVLAVLYGIQYVYLRTSRQLRFLDLEGQAPLQTHFLETIDGLATIRAFGWRDQAREKNWRLLDMSQRPFYLLLCAQVWLALVLDLVVAGIAVLVVTIALNTDHNTSAGSIGVSLLSILTFSGTLSNLIQAWTQLETSLGAVARIKELESSIASEDDGAVATSTFQPPQGWPSGRVDFNNVTAHYNTDSDPVLVDFNLHVKAGEKIGICGRSGSGKSSVLLALFRMLEVSPGSIEMDGIDIGHLHSKTLRSHLNVVPQEPVLLPGSLRFNIDPFGKATDEEIISVLGKIGLWSTLQTHEGGLGAPLEESSLSTGQQQLVSVARAMLKKTKILVLDEATSSVDSVTEEKIMNVVTDDFRDCTTIAVAHRVKTLRDFDRVVVMNSGRIAEIGSPNELLASDSLFKGLYDRS